MINKSHLLNALIFTLAVGAWVHIKTFDFNQHSSALKDTYASAFAATVVIYIASVIFQNVSLYDTYW
jgi:hypothetical protein